MCINSTTHSLPITFRAEMKHKMNPVLDAQLNRRRGFRGHKRNLSDPRFSTSLTDEYYTEDEVSESAELIEGRFVHPVGKLVVLSLSNSPLRRQHFFHGRRQKIFPSSGSD